MKEWVGLTNGRVIDFTTSQGKQRAFLQGNLRSPRNLWIVCGGNGSVALDWSEWLAVNAPPEDAWLLVDFPGYGECHGKPTPRSIRETFHRVIPIAIGVLGLPSSDSSRLRVFGHSLGAAACLIAATEFDIRRGVLLAPFTSTMDMAETMTGLPVGFLVIHRFDNTERLEELIAKGKTRFVILHGTDDEVIPVDMSRRLAAICDDSIRLREIQAGRHNDIARNHADELAKALSDAALP